MFTAILSQGPLILYQPAPSYSDFIERPKCSECESTTHLFGIEAADRFGYELFSFVCPKCDQIETAIEKKATTN